MGPQRQGCCCQKVGFLRDGIGDDMCRTSTPPFLLLGCACNFTDLDGSQSGATGGGDGQVMGQTRSIRECFRRGIRLPIDHLVQGGPVQAGADPIAPGHGRDVHKRSIRQDHVVLSICQTRPGHFWSGTSCMELTETASVRLRWLERAPAPRLGGAR